jgi:hypothetical protein
MKRNRFAIITSTLDSDLADILLNSEADTTVLKPTDLRHHQLDQFDSFAILGGTDQTHCS